MLIRDCIRRRRAATSRPARQSSPGFGGVCQASPRDDPLLRTLRLGWARAERSAARLAADPGPARRPRRRLLAGRRPRASISASGHQSGALPADQPRRRGRRGGAVLGLPSRSRAHADRRKLTACSPGIGREIGLAASGQRSVRLPRSWTGARRVVCWRPIVSASWPLFFLQDEARSRICRKILGTGVRCVRRVGAARSGLRHAAGTHGAWLSARDSNVSPRCRARPAWDLDQLLDRAAARDALLVVREALPAVKAAGCHGLPRRVERAA